jgi:hydrogenase expression/formation protein HypC
MCLGVPGQVVEISTDALGMAMGKVSFGGIRKEVCFAYVPDAKVGDYVLVHVGFALGKLDEAEARRTLALLEGSGAVEGELGPSDPAGGA